MVSPLNSLCWPSNPISIIHFIITIIRHSVKKTADKVGHNTILPVQVYN